MLGSSLKFGAWCSLFHPLFGLLPHYGLLDFSGDGERKRVNDPQMRGNLVVGDATFAKGSNRIERDICSRFRNNPYTDFFTQALAWHTDNGNILNALQLEQEVFNLSGENLEKEQSVR